MSDLKPYSKHEGGVEKAQIKNKKLILKASAKYPN